MNRPRHVALALLIVVIGTSASWAQIAPAPGDPAAAGSERAMERLYLALSDPSYPVTPGDVYELSYYQGSEQVIVQSVVSSDYALSLGVIGTLQVSEGDSYPDVRVRVEQLVTGAYRRGFPSLRIVSVGLFQVTLTGAIDRTLRIPAWGLTRLSELVQQAAADYTSLREVTVVSATGAARSYDTYRSLRHGAVEEDPLLRPGDTVLLGFQHRMVVVEGAVRVPGRYELLEGEGIEDLEEFFRGYDDYANQSRRVIRRRVGDEVRVLPLDGMRSVPLRSGDTLVVPSQVEADSVVIVEGAVRLDAAAPESAGPPYNRLFVPVSPGETLPGLLWRLNERLAAEADTERIRLIHRSDGTEIVADLEHILSDEGPSGDHPLQEIQRIVIPVRHWFVVVSGDVPDPGRFHYAAYEDPSYYLALAGMGAVDYASRASGMQLYDRDGVRKEGSDGVEPGDTIHVPFDQAQVEQLPTLLEVESQVLVTGAVANPGLYPVRAAQPAAYYIYQAGGANPENNSRGAFVVRTESGQRRSGDETIASGDTITVRRNDFIYNFNRFFPVISGGLAVITASLTILNALVE